MNDSIQKPDDANPRLVLLDLEFARSYFRKGESHDHFVCATKDGTEVMIAKRCSDGSTFFEPVSEEHLYTAQTFSKVRLHYDTLARLVRE